MKHLIPLFFLIIGSTSLAQAQSFDCTDIANKCPIQTDSVQIDQNGADWNYITFDEPFDASHEVVVFALSHTEDNKDPMALRFAKVGQNGFYVAQREPENVFGSNDPSVPPSTIQYIAAAVGEYKMEDGSYMEVGTETVDKYQLGTGNNTHPPSGNNEGWHTFNFQNNFSGNPSLTAQIQTFNNEATSPGDASCSWMTEVIAKHNPNSYVIAMEKSEVRPWCGDLQKETMGYLAIDHKANGRVRTWDGRMWVYEGQYISTRYFQGYGTCRTIENINIYNAPSTMHIIGSKNALFGGDGGWLRRCKRDVKEVGFFVDEDQYLNGERNHTTEPASFFILGQTSEVTEKRATAMFRNGTIVPTNGTAYPGDVIHYVLQVSGVGSIYDVHDPAKLNWLASDPIIGFGTTFDFDASGDYAGTGTIYRSLEYVLDGTQSIVRVILEVQ